MIHKAIEILKMRWPEVMLVVVLQAALMIFMSESSATLQSTTPEQNAQVPFLPQFLMGFGGILCGTIWTMLYLGFLKSAAMEGVSPQQPMDLVRMGRPYFWKILLFQFLLVFILWTLSTIIIAVLAKLVWRTQDLTKIPEWFFLVCVLAGMVLLMKPALFIPARIIVYDDTVMQAVYAMRQYRINDVDGLFRLIAVLVGVVTVFMFLIGLVTVKTVMYYILSGTYHIVLGLMSLWLMLTLALWFQKQLENQLAQSKEGRSQE